MVAVIAGRLSVVRLSVVRLSVVRLSVVRLSVLRRRGYGSPSCIGSQHTALIVPVLAALVAFAFSSSRLPVERARNG